MTSKRKENVMPYQTGEVVSPDNATSLLAQAVAEALATSEAEAQALAPFQAVAVSHTSTTGGKIGRAHV